jgi:hypothetical protein
MFYAQTLDRALRFGDVVRGYVSVVPTINRPVSDMSHIIEFCKVSIEVPLFSVVVTPCCSIEESLVCLTPLVQLRKSFVKNPHFVNDFTIINREIEPYKCFSPEDWEGMDAEKRQQLEATKKPYTLLNFFVYEKSDHFTPYPLRDKTVSHYMIDFRNIYTIRCGLIKRVEKMGQEEAVILDSKCLQLSESTREELRNKLAYYFGRVPDEDLVIPKN